MDATVPVRSYVLLRGPLADAGDWSSGWLLGQDPYAPAFIWPADHAWCVASDVDPHWAGIGAHAGLIERILSNSRLDAVAAGPAADQPTPASRSTRGAEPIGTRPLSSGALDPGYRQPA
jgi:hypothetical protein